jgi:hypothetical protein
MREFPRIDQQTTLKLCLASCAQHFDRDFSTVLWRMNLAAALTFSAVEAISKGRTRTTPKLSHAG